MPEWTRVYFTCECMFVHVYTCVYMDYTTLERRVETAPWMLTWAKAWLSRQWSIARLLPRKAHPYAQGWKEAKKRKREREKRKEEKRGGKRVKEKPEDSQLSTLSDDDIIVRATYISPLYQELFPAAFAQNENKRWWNLLNYKLRKRGTLDRGMFFCLLSTSYVTISNFIWDTFRLIIIIAFELFNVYPYVFKFLIFLFRFLIFLCIIRKGIKKQRD